MVEVKLYLYKSLADPWGSDGWDKSPIFKTLEVDGNETFWGKPLLVDGKFYRVVMGAGDNRFAIDEMKNYKHDEDLDKLREVNEDVIICPVCGNVEADPYEYPENEDDDHECEGCGSILSWNRDYTVTYTVDVKKINTFKELR